jgi:hypothetical protein
MMDRAFVRMLALWLALWPHAAAATQNELVPPTSGIYTGIQFSQKIGDAFRSIGSWNKGPTAPANVGGSSVDGLGWIDDSVTPWIVKRYVNGNWVVEGFLDPADSSYAGVIGGGIGSIASASTVDLNSVPQANVTITGTATIAGFGAAAPAGVVKFLRFDSALIITHSSSLTVPGGFPLTTAANDRAIVTHLGSGNWEITQYTRANGIPIDVAAVGEPRMTFNAATPPLSLPGDGRAITRVSYPAYTAKMSRAQNGTRTSGNATITGIADTSRFGVGMPAESTGVNAGCTIASFVANSSITLNSPSCVTSSGTSTVTVFLTGYGSGGSASTIGVPNCQGAVIAGLDPTRARLTLGSNGFNADAAAMGVFGGGESLTLSLAQLPTGITAVSAGSLGAQVTSNNWIASSTNDSTGINPGGTGGAGGTVSLSGFSVSKVVSNGSTSGSLTSTSNNTLGNPHRTVPPTLIAQCDVRVTP